LLAFTTAAADDDPDGETVAIAFALCTGAGLCTCLGALIVFSERAVTMANHQVLAAALALSAGVMIYVSFVEMFAEALHKFSLAGYGELEAEAYTVISFFGGMAICKGLDILAHMISGDNHHHDDPMEPGEHAYAGCCEIPVITSKNNKCIIRSVGSDEEPGKKCEDTLGSDDPVARLEDGTGTRDPSPPTPCKGDDNDMGHGHGHGHGHGKGCSDAAATVPQDASAVTASGENHAHKKSLRTMGCLTAVAVALHNFPEGLATFIGTLDDTSVGAGLAVAIAVHNIPEGIAVAMPIYYGTGSRSKAFLWALLSGLCEPLGALIGYAVLMDHFSDLTFGITFAIVAGMMVYISFGCLLPTASKYDPQNKVVAPFVVIGMFIMALSIVLFKI